MSCLDHINIICPVSNRESIRIETPLDKVDHLSLLFGSDSAADNAVHESQNIEVILVNGLKNCAFNYHDPLLEVELN